MKRIAIIGGGISGLAAAYELELARKRGADIDWHLYEASNRLGGIIQTTLHATPEGEYILEGGPDAWVTDKPWARELAIELGLQADLIESNDATRKTYILHEGQLQAIPDHMRMMVPEDLSSLEASPLFSAEAKAAYAAEITRAEELKASVPEHDESVASFVRRHFGDEVLATLAAPLLSGVFGGDVYKLSVRAVMAPFVKMEQEHGSLILALQTRTRERGSKPPQAIFTSLRRGMGSLVDAILAKLPAERLHLNNPALSLKREGKLWCLRYATPSDRGIPGKSKKHFKQILLATPLDTSRSLITPESPEAAALAPTEASSAVLTTFTWPAELASTFTIPPGFGFLVSQRSTPTKNSRHPERSAQRGVEGTPYFADGGTPVTGSPELLAATFVDHKFPHRAPPGARILRAFFGGAAATTLTPQTDETIAQAAFDQLQAILGPLPKPAHQQVHRWPRSLPQYEVGHLERITELEEILSGLPGLTLLGNSYRGVGVPDLIHNARTAARKLIPVP